MLKMPPEQRDMNKYCADWFRNPHGHAHGYDRAYSIEHVTWQLAAIIFGLMMRSTDNTFLDDQMKAMQNKEDVLWARNLNLLRWNKGQDREYSDELIDLVNDCLNIDPRKRPSPYGVMHRTKKGIEQAARDIQSKGGRAPKVFSGENAVREMEAYFQPGRGGGDQHGVMRRRLQRFQDEWL
jgi:hypothetical protein